MGSLHESRVVVVQKRINAQFAQTILGSIQSSRFVMEDQRSYLQFEGQIIQRSHLQFVGLTIPSYSGVDNSGGSLRAGPPTFHSFEDCSNEENSQWPRVLQHELGETEQRDLTAAATGSALTWKTKGAVLIF